MWEVAGGLDPSLCCPFPCRDLLVKKYKELDFGVKEKSLLM